jgi:hypothetical protein
VVRICSGRVLGLPLVPAGTNGSPHEWRHSWSPPSLSTDLPIGIQIVNKSLWSWFLYGKRRLLA